MNNYYPKITIAMPTFNSEPRLEKCLKLIRKNNYPQDKIEIIIADGGSNDNTITIAKKYNCIVLENSRKLPEPGKAVGIKNASGDLICFIDDDNYIYDNNFFNKMVKPFEDKEISATEPWKYDNDKKLKPLERYWSYMGLNDPTMYYIGCYDRFNLITGKWTSLKIKSIENENFEKIFLNFDNLPTIGANAFMARTNVMRKIDYENLLDLDKMAAMVKAGYNKFAKVKVGLVHTFVSDLKGYWIKCLRKANSFYGEVGYKGQNANEKTERMYKYPHLKIGLIKFILATILILPNIIECIILFFKTRDVASFLHFPVCWITLIGYAKKTIFK